MGNSLDARALAAPGGFAGSLTEALAHVMDGYASSQDRQSERGFRLALKKMEDRRQQYRDALLLADKGVATGDVGEMTPDQVAAMGLLAQKARDAEAWNRTRQGNADALDRNRSIAGGYGDEEQARSTWDNRQAGEALGRKKSEIDLATAQLAQDDTRRKMKSAFMGDVESGYAAPDVTDPLQVQAATLGGQKRAADLAVRQGEADWYQRRGQPTLLETMKAMNAATAPRKIQNIHEVKDAQGNSSLVQVNEDGTYVPLTNAAAGNEPTSINKEAETAMGDALTRYHQGGWFGRGKGNSEPLRQYDRAALQRVASRLGLQVPGDAPTSPTAPAPVAAPSPAAGQNIGPDVSPQDMQAWMDVLRRPGTPEYQNSIIKLRRWSQGVGEDGAPNPVLKQRAAAITAALNTAR